jgi:nucleotidyltransferase/DNA polymerase involved in DNA repair
MRWVFYVDMDAFYVSCQLRERPELVGTPVIVGRQPKTPHDRGVVLSASYEARAKGVRSAMPSVRAAELLPQATWIPPNFTLYEAASRELSELLEETEEHVGRRSIDEAVVQGEFPDAASARGKALALQAEIRTRLRLPSSIGVSPHEVVAKIASDRAKPNGVVVVAPEETAAFLAPLPVRSVPGVGPKAEALLAELGVRSIDDLRRVDPGRLRRRFGRFGEELRALARGEPAPASRERSGPRQRSVDRTLEEDTRELAILGPKLRQLAHDLASSLSEEHLRFQSVVVRLRWADFQQSQAGRRLPAGGDAEELLWSEARRLLVLLLERERSRAGRPVRRLSLAVHELAPVAQRQLHLTETPPEPMVKAGSLSEDSRDHA